MALQREQHPIYSKAPSTVHIVYRKNKRRCLELAVRRSGFINHLNSRWRESGKKKEDFRIAIKPNFMCAGYETDVSVYTDVELVERLIEIIRAQGYRHIDVVESQMVWSLLREGRTVRKVAAMLGYSGRGYRIVDMTKKREPHDYKDDLLGHHTVGPAWRDADYRISFAKNKTHFQSFYTGCMKNVYGCLPEQDKLKVYHGHVTDRDREYENCAIAILEAFPVHFAFLDAYFSGDGLAGLIKDPRPNETSEIICGENCYAVDWVQGEKMKLDPRKNPLIRLAEKKWGTPVIQRKGPMKPYDPWKNVPSIVSMFADLIEESYHLSRFFCFIFSYHMHKRYKPVSCPLNTIALPFRFLAKTIEHHWGLVCLGLLAVTVLLSVAVFMKGSAS
jgi:uncharacterized protein (DUF362 family)